METLLILLFCLAIGYVCIWVLVNERQGNVNGEWGFIAMRVSSEKSDDSGDRTKAPPSPRGWKP